MPNFTRLWVAAESIVVAITTSVAASVAVGASFFLFGFEVMRFVLGLVGLAGLIPCGTPKEYIPKSIIITGASSGIGENLAIEYARPGVWLGLTGRNEERLNEVANKCRQRGASVEIGLIDVTDAKKLAEWLLKYDDAHPTDLLLANAGVAASQFPDHTFEQRLDTIFDINVRGVFNTVNPLLPRFRARRSGQIAINASISGIIGVGYSPMTIYATTKATMVTFGQHLRGLVEPDNVAVNVIAPAFVRSNMTKAHEARGGTPFIIDADVAATLIKNQLQANVALICFPTSMYAMIHATRGFPMNVWEPMQRLVLHAFGKKKTA